jgi:hypothetical protein
MDKKTTFKKEKNNPSKPILEKSLKELRSIHPIKDKDKYILCKTLTEYNVDVIYQPPREARVQPMELVFADLKRKVKDS